VFLETEAREAKQSISSTRLALARAKNKNDKDYQNFLKSKERAQAAIEKMKENEAAYLASSEDVERLKRLVNEDAMDLK
jgi:cell division septum initiation protein DivIVA